MKMTALVVIACSVLLVLGVTAPNSDLAPIIKPELTGTITPTLTQTSSVTTTSIATQTPTAAPTSDSTLTPQVTPTISPTPSPPPPSALMADIFSLGFFNNVTTFFVCNPATGELTALNTFPEVAALSAFVAAIDPEHHHYFQPVIDNSFTERLLKIDTITGELLAQPPFSTTLSTLQYHRVDNYLYGLAYDIDLASNTLVKINPATFEQTLVVAFPEVSAILAGVSALDIETNHYFFVGYVAGIEHLYDINIQTEDVIATPVTYSIVHFEFDLNDGALIAVIWYPPDMETLQLVRIDPTTGGIMVIISIPEIKALFQGASALDPTENLYTFPVVDLADTQRLFIFDTQTGELVATPELVVTSGTNPLSQEMIGLLFTGQLQSFEAELGYQVYLPFVMK